MERGSVNLFRLFFFWFVIVQGFITEGRNLYVSRVSGHVDWSCDQSKPCKTIWQAVTLASQGDHIYLDGTDTDKDPYTCQSGTSEHPGIYINKSLSLIGFASPMPQLRCSEETGLVFIGSENAKEMTVSLSGLFLNESFVRVQDFSVEINACKFKGIKKGLQFVKSTNMASSIEITNSTFSGNHECISVVVNNTMCPPQNIQVAFKLTNSSFDGNVLSDDRGCISFTEMPYSNQFVSCNITLENVTLSRNKLGSKGLVFLNMGKGNQNIHFQNVTFIDNRQLSGRAVLTSTGDSECIIRSSAVNIFIMSSNFKSQTSRSFNVSASNISLQIYNSGFIGHRVEGNGGVITLRGTELYMLNVSDSSFVNTTAAQGGAINIECANVGTVSFENNIFMGNTATYGVGGAVYIYSPGTYGNASGYSIEEKADIDYGIYSERLLQINVTKCSFINAKSSSGGSAMYIKALKASVRLRHSALINCTCAAASCGGGVLINTGFASLKRRPGNDLLLIVESSRFKWCESGRSNFGGSLSVLFNTAEININTSHFVSNYGGAINFDSYPADEGFSKKPSYVTVENSMFFDNYGSATIVVFVYKQSVLFFKNVTIESNRAPTGDIEGAALIGFNCTLKIHQCRFLKTEAFAGVFRVLDTNVLEVKDSVFDANYGVGCEALNINCNLISTSIVIFNTTFKNCSTTQRSGAIYLSHEGNVSLAVKMSRFMDNSVLNYSDFGASIYLSLTADNQINPGCIRNCLSTASQINDAQEFPSWSYKSHLIFEDTTFERNAGTIGGAVYLTSGKAIFRNCSFLDNFALYLGGHIYTVAGSASLIIQNSVFRQTINELKLPKFNYSKTSFIHSESSGALKLCNTTMNATPYGSTGPLILVRNGRIIDLGNNNITTLNCPVGSQMKILNFTDQITTQTNSTPCKIKLTTLEFSCSTCSDNSYSLQRGRAFGSQLVPGFQCLPCPFGANCSQNIVAETNFWGFKAVDSPPTLTFTMCPLGYCRSPNKTDFPEYNGCQGNRSGELCGQCNESYTETLYSTNCRPSHECKDYWFWPVALVYVSLMAFYFSFKPPIVPWIKRQILWFKKRELADEDNDFDSGYLKIVFYFYQAANLVLVSNSTQHILKTKFIRPFVGLFNFEQRFSPSGLICPFPGLTVVTKQLFSASHVLGTFVMTGVFFILHVGVKKFQSQEFPSAAPYIGGVLQTILLGYTTLASVSFNLLRCVPIGSEKRLFYDGNVVCLQWWQYGLIAFIVTFFVPFVFVLLWASFKLYSRTISVGRFLLACCLPLPSFIYWVCSSLFCKARNTAKDESPSSQLSRNSVERVLYDCFERPEDGNKLSLSWEGVMIGRRLILVVLKAFISDPILRLLSMSFFCVLFLLQHAMTQPFRDGVANIVETLSLLFIVLLGMINMFFASFLSLAVPLNDHFTSWWNACQLVEIIILCAVPAVFGFLLVAALLSQLCRLTVAVCHFLCHLLWVCFSWRCRKQDDEVRPVLASES